MNRLHSEKSPYLLQHADNPVDWHPWGDGAFRKAALEDKPVFLSIGYSTCHWCHVMAHESFEDPAVAQLLNQDFISIKVDREERPDVDAVYMTVCQNLTGSGGWPLTIIMTPDQKPFFAGTYFPRLRRFRQPGLMEILEQAARLWKSDRPRLLQAGEQITAALEQVRPTDAREPDKNLLHKGYQLFRRQYDAKWGGFGTAPKFPAPHNLLFLMQYAALEQEPEALAMAEATLTAMERGGIHDQIGGGFSRYSTDERWLVPHFEKMLYDNALLILAYVTAYQITGKALYADTARRTADYILRELTHKSGGFFCSQDADSDGVEGKYYVFTPAEIRSVLGQAQGSEVCRLYGITENGNFEGKSIPNRIGVEDAPLPADDAQLQSLCKYRLERTQLHKDDKILLSWNAWTILALARAGRAFSDERYRQAAIQAAEFIEDNMTDQRNRLYLRWRDGEAAHAGQLEDYAVYALALTELYQLTFQPVYLQQAVDRARQMAALFEDKEQGGYFITACDAEQLIARPKETYDGAIPSGNSAAAAVLQRLASLTGETIWQEAADRQLRFLAGETAHYPAGYSFALSAAASALYPHRELVGTIADGLPEDFSVFLRTQWKNDLNILIKTADNAEALAVCAPFTKEYPLPKSGAAWYLCENGACQAPVTDFSMLPMKGN